MSRPNSPTKKDPLYQAMISPTPPNANLQPCTLDEPVTDTLMRDLRQIGQRVTIVLLMNQSPADTLRTWDLWGPLVMGLTLAIGLGCQADRDGAAVFTLLIMLVSLGSLVVTLNCRLLGYRIAILQTVCLLGYCLFPLAVLSLITAILPLFWILRLILTAAALGWSTVASVRILNDPALEERRLLAVYPIFLLYLAISWMILIA